MVTTLFITVGALLLAMIGSVVLDPCAGRSAFPVQRAGPIVISSRPTWWGT